MPRRFLFLLLCSTALTSIAIAQSAGRTVDFTSADGTKLKGTYYAAAKAGPGVLLLHQCNKDRNIWNGLAAQLAGAGLNVLTFDLRNFGDSQGEPFAKLTPQKAQAAAQKWPADVDAAFQYLVSQSGVKRDVIGVGGASCGVNNSVQAARRHPEVKSLVLLAGNTDLKGREFLRNSKNQPILFGYADDDEFPASIRTIQWLYSLAPNAGNRLVRYPNGGHGAEIFAVHPEFEGVIKDWFVTTLIKTPGKAPAATHVSVAKDLEILNTIDEPGGADKVSRMLKEVRAKDPKATLFPEDVVNIMGYEHMQAGDTKGAVEIFKLNVEAYPNSANVYDSVSDAYLADGQRDLARENAKRALEMLAKDTSVPEATRNGIKASSEQKLKQLGESPQ